MNEKSIPQRDLTISDVIRITGIAKNRAYAFRYHGEYKIGNGQKNRRIRREEFMYRRQNGLNIVVDD
jgi:hypothetical protein